MNIKISPNPLSGTVEAISSKSHAHRLMIAAHLCKEPCKVHIAQMNEDLHATQNCLSSLDDECPVLDCGESGSTLRFLLPMVMALKDKAVFLGSGRLPERPLSPLKEEMEAHGSCFSGNLNEERQNESTILQTMSSSHICSVTGKLQGGTFRLAGNVSSQYITGLLFALPLLEGDSTIEVTSKLESIGYVRLTLEVLNDFGIHIQTTDFQTFFIKGHQQYHSPKEVTAEGDWSNSAFFLVADKLLSKEFSVVCTGLRTDSQQGDKAIVSFKERIASAKEGETLSFDVADVPDLVPILSVLCASRRGVSHITNAGRLRIKESDRLATVRELLENLGGKAEERSDGLVIYGNGTLTGGVVNGHNDHRIVMATAIASILCKEPVTILGAEAVNKSYPTFFKDFASLGGEYIEL